MEDRSAYEEDHFVVGGDVGFAVLIPHHAALREAPLLHLALDDVRVLVGHLRRQRQGVGLFPHQTQRPNVRDDSCKPNNKQEERKRQKARRKAKSES